MTVSYFVRLFEYAAWANERACEAIAQLSDDASQRHQALKLLGHILNAGKMWRTNRLEKLDVPALTTWPAYSLDECRDNNQRELDAHKKYLGTLQDSDLANMINYTNMAGDPFSSSIEDILMHMVNHETHHRGQIMQLVRQAGGAPASTDYIAYTRVIAQNA